MSCLSWIFNFSWKMFSLEWSKADDLFEKFDQEMGRKVPIGQSGSSWSGLSVASTRHQPDDKQVCWRCGEKEALNGSCVVERGSSEEERVLGNELIWTPACHPQSGWHHGMGCYLGPCLSLWSYRSWGVLTMTDVVTKVTGMPGCYLWPFWHPQGLCYHWDHGAILI